MLAATDGPWREDGMARWRTILKSELPAAGCVNGERSVQKRHRASAAAGSQLKMAMRLTLPRSPCCPPPLPPRSYLVRDGTPPNKDDEKRASKFFYRIGPKSRGCIGEEEPVDAPVAARAPPHLCRCIRHEHLHYIMNALSQPRYATAPHAPAGTPSLLSFVFKLTGMAQPEPSILRTALGPEAAGMGLGVSSTSAKGGKRKKAKKAAEDDDE
jgi:hypothetical protein